MFQRLAGVAHSGSTHLQEDKVSRGHGLRRFVGFGVTADLRAWGPRTGKWWLGIALLRCRWVGHKKRRGPFWGGWGCGLVKQPGVGTRQGTHIPPRGKLGRGESAELQKIVDRVDPSLLPGCRDGGQFAGKAGQGAGVWTQYRDLIARLACG